MQRIRRCKGSNDLNPVQMRRFRKVESVFTQVCSLWDYQEIRTPTLEYLYLFTSAGTLTQKMLKRVYSFLDWDGWSGERVVLKPDATIPATRYYIESGSEDARYYYVTNTFVFEETGSKNRERWQCGAELIGAKAPLADIELLSLTLDIIFKLNISDILVKFSHGGVIRNLLSEMGLTEHEQSNMFENILNGDTAEIQQFVDEKPEATEALLLLINHKGNSAAFIKNIKSILVGKSNALAAALDDFIAVLTLADEMGVTYEIDLPVGKGFEYYTGLIFRLDTQGINIGGGGRYDQLIPMMGGESTPAAGFALYMDKLMQLITLEDSADDSKKAAVIRVSPATLKQGLDAAAKLRRDGIKVRFENDDTPSQSVCS